MKKKKARTDFRYDTGEARVPWAAVGEKVNVDDIVEIIKFLVPGGEKDENYNRQLSQIENGMRKLQGQKEWRGL